MSRTDDLDSSYTDYLEPLAGLASSEDLQDFLTHFYKNIWFKTAQEREELLANNPSLNKAFQRFVIIEKETLISAEEFWQRYYYHTYHSSKEGANDDDDKANSNRRVSGASVLGEAEEEPVERYSHATKSTIELLQVAQNRAVLDGSGGSGMDDSSAVSRQRISKIDFWKQQQGRNSLFLLNDSKQDSVASNSKGSLALSSQSLRGSKSASSAFRRRRSRPSKEIDFLALSSRGGSSMESTMELLREASERTSHIRRTRSSDYASVMMSGTLDESVDSTMSERSNRMRRTVSTDSSMASETNTTLTDIDAEELLLAVQRRASSIVAVSDDISDSENEFARESEATMSFEENEELKEEDETAQGQYEMDTSAGRNAGGDDGKEQVASIQNVLGETATQTFAEDEGVPDLEGYSIGEGKGVQGTLEEQEEAKQQQDTTQVKKMDTAVIHTMQDQPGDTTGHIPSNQQGTTAQSTAEEDRDTQGEGTMDAADAPIHRIIEGDDATKEIASKKEHLIEVARGGDNATEEGNKEEEEARSDLSNTPNPLEEALNWTGQMWDDLNASVRGVRGNAVTEEVAKLQPITEETTRDENEDKRETDKEEEKGRRSSSHTPNPLEEAINWTGHLWGDLNASVEGFRRYDGTDATAEGSSFAEENKNKTEPDKNDQEENEMSHTPNPMEEAMNWTGQLWEASVRGIRGNRAVEENAAEPQHTTGGNYFAEDSNDKAETEDEQEVRNEMSHVPNPLEEAVYWTGELWGALVKDLTDPEQQEAVPEPEDPMINSSRRQALHEGNLATCLDGFSAGRQPSEFRLELPLRISEDLEARICQVAAILRKNTSVGTVTVLVPTDAAEDEWFHPALLQLFEAIGAMEGLEHLVIESTAIRRSRIATNLITATLQGIVVQTKDHWERGLGSLTIKNIVLVDANSGEDMANFALAVSTIRSIPINTQVEIDIEIGEWNGAKLPS